MNKMLLLVLLLANVGCLSVDLEELTKDAPQQRRFLLNASPTGEAVAAPTSAPVLEVGLFHGNHPFSAQALVYALGQNQFETDFHNQFLTPPAQQLTQICQSWLRHSGLFQAVTATGAMPTAKYHLDADLMELVADLSGDAPLARLKLQVILSQKDSKDGSLQPLLQKDYVAEQKLDSDAAPAIVAGFDLCVAEVMQALLQDLGELLRK